MVSNQFRTRMSDDDMMSDNEMDSGDEEEEFVSFSGDDSDAEGGSDGEQMAQDKSKKSFQDSKPQKQARSSSAGGFDPFAVETKRKKRGGTFQTMGSP
jgi:hypothetical protein